MLEQPPYPTEPASSRADVFATYLDYFRAAVVVSVRSLPDAEVRTSRLSSGWTPAELMKHLTYVERRWLEWGFEGREVGDPWGDRRDDRWFVDESETVDELVAALESQGGTTRRIIEGADLATVGQPSARWDGDEPPTLERILLHLLQEYARHLGHLDIVVELSGAAAAR